MTQANNNPDSNEDLQVDQKSDTKLDQEVVEQDEIASSGQEGSNDPNIALLEALKEIKELKKEVASAHDKYLRSLADFENFKRRSIKERSELLKYQGEPLILDLLRVIDDFDLAMRFVNEQGAANASGSEAAVESDPQKFKQGIELIYKGFCDVLKKWDIRPESSIGKVFDPVKQLAISRVSLPDAAPGTVVSELKKAFFYKDKLIRVAEVVVAAEPAAE